MGVLAVRNAGVNIQQPQTEGVTKLNPFKPSHSRFARLSIAGPASLWFLATHLILALACHLFLRSSPEIYVNSD